jgi:hypothetical protein
MQPTPLSTHSSSSAIVRSCTPSAIVQRSITCPCYLGLCCPRLLQDYGGNSAAHTVMAVANNNSGNMMAYSAAITNPSGDLEMDPTSHPRPNDTIQLGRCVLPISSVAHGLHTSPLPPPGHICEHLPEATHTVFYITFPGNELDQERVERERRAELPTHACRPDLVSPSWPISDGYCASNPHHPGVHGLLSGRTVLLACSGRAPHPRLVEMCSVKRSVRRNPLVKRLGDYGAPTTACGLTC